MILKSEIKSVTRDTDQPWVGEVEARVQFTSRVQFSKELSRAEEFAIQEVKDRLWHELRGELMPLLIEAFNAARISSDFHGQEKIEKAFAPLFAAIKGEAIVHEEKFA